jgi:dihydrofolate reductase
MHISLIAVIDEENGLGKDNQLLCHLPADLKHFKAITLNKPILMGHNTFLSIGRPLPQRKNIVLTRKKREEQAGVFFVENLEQAFELADNNEVMIIGGSSLYHQSIEMGSKLYLTQIHHRFQADVFFPDIDKTVWEKTSTHYHPKDEKNPYDYTFMEFERIERGRKA